MGAVADHGHAFLGNGGENHLAIFAVGHGVAGLRIQYLDDHVVLIDMHALLFKTFKGNAGAGDLGKAVDVARVDAQQFFQMDAHLLGPGLRAEASCPELYVLAGRKAHVADGLAQIGGVGRGAAKYGGAHLAHHHNLALGIAGGHGDGHRAYGGGALMRAQAAGEQAVAVTHLHDIVPVRARAGERAGHHLGPHIHVVLGVAGNDGLACGAGGALNTHYVAQGAGQQPVGKLIAQIGLFSEGQLYDICQGIYILGLHALRVHALAVHGHVFINVLNDRLEPLSLELFTLLAIHTFHFGIPDLVFACFSHLQSSDKKSICVIIHENIGFGYPYIIFTYVYMQ